MPRTDALRAETIAIPGDGGDDIEAYLAYPLDEARRSSVIVIHHLPGYDEPSREITRKFADHGYLSICPNLHYREAPTNPDEATSKVRERGGVPDGRLIGDIQGATAYLRARPTEEWVRWASALAGGKLF